MVIMALGRTRSVSDGVGGANPVAHAPGSPSGSALFRPAVAEDFAERLDGQREQVRPGDPAGRAAASQMGFQDRVSGVPPLNGIGDAVRDLAVAGSWDAAGVLLPAGLPVLDLEVGRVPFRLL